MVDIICQFTGVALSPFSEEDLESLHREYKKNEKVRVKCTRVSKAIEPSVTQNGLLHKVFEVVAENSDDPKLNTKEKVKFNCKVALDYRHQDRVAVAPDGSIVFEYRSFSFDELKHMERVNLFDRAFQWSADCLGLTVDELVKEAKAGCGGCDVL